MWEIKAVNVIFIMSINSFMPIIFLGYFISFLHASVFSFKHIEKFWNLLEL